MKTTRCLLLFVLVSVALAQSQCQFASNGAIYDLSVLTNTGPANGSYPIFEPYNGYTFYFNFCGTAPGCSGSICARSYANSSLWVNAGLKESATWFASSSAVYLVYRGDGNEPSCGSGRVTQIQMFCSANTTTTGFYSSSIDSCNKYFQFRIPCSRQCTNCSNHGRCISGADLGSSCSCYSGFNGTSCEVRPSSLCTPSPVQSNAVNFRPTVTVQTVPDGIIFNVSAPMQQSPLAAPFRNDALVDPSIAYSNVTLINFSSNSSTICDYPGRFWNTTNAGCLDGFASAINVSTMIKSCGLTQSDAGYYNGVLTVSRDYVLPDQYAPTFTRVEKQSIPFSIVYPMSVGVSSDISMNNNQFASAIVSSVFDLTLQRWNVSIKTVTAPFYSLALRKIYFKGQSASRATVGDLSTCQPDALGRCYQVLTVTIDGCSAVDLTADVSFTQTCTDSDCGSSESSITAVVTTASSCPVINNIGFSRTQMSSFSSATLGAPQSTFSPLQSAYFGISLASAQATLAKANVTSVCVQFESGAPCFPVPWTTIGLPAGSSYQVAFSFLVGKIPNPSGAPKCTVIATLGLQWRALGKRSDSEPTGVANLSTEISLEQPAGDQQVAPSNGANSARFWAASLAVLVLSAL